MEALDCNGYISFRGVISVPVISFCHSLCHLYESLTIATTSAVNRRQGAVL